MNQISYQDFGLLKSEFLNVDYICLNINSSSNLYQIASYFQALEKQQRIRSEVLILPSNETHNIHQITYRHLNKNNCGICDIRFN